MEGSVLSFLKAEWKVSDTGSAHWSSSILWFCTCKKKVNSCHIYKIDGKAHYNSKICINTCGLADDIFIGDVQKSNNREIRSTNWQVGMDLTEFTYLYIVFRWIQYFYYFSIVFYVYRGNKLQQWFFPFLHPLFLFQSCVLYKLEIWNRSML